MEYTQLESLIPLKDEREMKNEIEKKRGKTKFKIYLFFIETIFLFS